MPYTRSVIACCSVGMRSGTPRLQAVVCSRGLFAVHLRHRPATMSLNGRKRAETHRAYCAAITEGCGPKQNLRFVAHDFHVINAGPAASEKIEGGTDLVRPAMMCDAVPDINACVLLWMVGVTPISLIVTQPPPSSTHWQYAFYYDRAPPVRMDVSSN